ncbi:MAG: hypothetical protein P8Z33_13565 [Gammaproteobacteria bacterium]
MIKKDVDKNPGIAPEFRGDTRLAAPDERVRIGESINFAVQQNALPQRRLEFLTNPALDGSLSER